ncbi:MAG: hypothetical protein QXS81_01485 [Candidatus Micrarchaeaceae archaeon]
MEKQKNRAKSKYTVLHIESPVAQEIKELARNLNVTQSELLHILAIYGKSIKISEISYVNPTYKNMQLVKKYSWG